VARDLSIQDVAEIIERVPDLSEMMLVGGQALNYWSETLGIADAQSTGPYGAATSEIRVPQMDRLVARRYKKYEELRWRIKARGSS
jgi:hypothetical protein